MLKKFKIASAIASAPFTYLVGRALGRSDIAAHSANLDPFFFRGYSARLKSRGLSAEAFGRFTQAAQVCASANIDISDFMNSHVHISHGQLLQDIICLLVNSSKKSGYFVEVGVGDGTKYSNTLLLERDFGWTGILAEPAIMFHDAIAGSRSAVLDKRAVSENSGQKVIFEQDDATGELSGLLGHRTPRGTQKLTAYEVETIRFDDLLDQHNAPDIIDYISIDTEGSELSVLAGLSLNKRRVGFFSIEHNFHNDHLEAFDKLLLPMGYRRILAVVSSFDAWYVHKEHNGIFN